MRHKFYYISIFFLVSCVKDYPLKSSGKMEPLPVFHMFVQPDSTITAHYSHAADITENILGDDAADIEVYKNNILLGKMTSIGDGKYSIPSFQFNPRDSFKVVTTDGVHVFDINGVTPSKIQIIKVDTSTALIPGVGPAFNLKLQFRDSALDDNYYRIYLKRKYFKYKLDGLGKIVDSTYTIENISVLGSELSFIQNNFNNYTSREILFSDATFNGTLINLNLYTTEQLHNKKNGRTVFLEIVMENLNKSIYDYYNTRNAHLWQQQSIAQLPGQIQGNIPGGFGVVGAFTFSKKVIGF